MDQIRLTIIGKCWICHENQKWLYRYERMFRDKLICSKCFVIMLENAVQEYEDSEEENKGSYIFEFFDFETNTSYKQELQINSLKANLELAKENSLKYP